MKRYIKLELHCGDVGMFSFDSLAVSEEEALYIIKSAYEDHRDDIDAFRLNLSMNQIDVIEPDLTVELSDLGASGFVVEVHCVQYGSGDAFPALFAFGDVHRTTGEYFRKIQDKDNWAESQKQGGYSVID